MVDVEREGIARNAPPPWVEWWRGHLQAGLDQVVSAKPFEGGVSERGVPDGRADLNPAAASETSGPAPAASRLDHLKFAEAALRALACEAGDFDAAHQAGEPAGPTTPQDGPNVPGTHVPSEALCEAIDILTSNLADLRTEIIAELRKADKSGAIIERLEDELAVFKRREVERQKEAVFKGLVAIYDDVCSVLRHARSEERAERPDAAPLLKSLCVFQTQVLELLRRNGVSDFQPEPGAKFDPRAHEALATVENADEAQDMLVASVSRLGFEHAERVMRPAAVTVYRYRPPPADGEGER